MDPAQPRPQSGARKRKRRGLLLVILVLVALDQGLHRLAFRDGFLRGVRVAPFDPPLFSDVQLEAVRQLRAELAGAPRTGRNTGFDPELGWDLVPGGGAGEDRIDADGARAGAASNAERHVLVYGCSYTYGSEVSAAEAWPQQLDAQLEDTRIRNLGVPGYGIDQALLRFRQQALAGSEVWLAYLPYASTRTVVQYRPVLRHYSPTVAFKPRFELDPAGSLVLRPQPARTREERLELSLDARRFLDAVGATDAYVRDLPAAFAPTGSHWTHHTGFGRAALTLLDRRRPDPVLRLTDPDDEARRLVIAIGREMASEAAQRGMGFRILVLPSLTGLLECAQGPPPWQGITASWERAGIQVIDLTKALASTPKGELPALFMPGGHYRPETNGRIAAHLASRLQSN